MADEGGSKSQGSVGIAAPFITKLGQYTMNLKALFFVGIVLALSSAVQARTNVCIENGVKVFRSEPCYGTTPLLIYTTVRNSQASQPARTYQPDGLPDSTPSTPSRLSELLATCHQQFSDLLANADKGGLGGGSIYQFRSSLLRAKCSSPSLECYNDFNALQDDLDHGGLGGYRAAKTKLSIIRAKCGMPE